MSKLVRDRTRDVLEPQNPRIVFGRVLEGEREGLLFSKLLEEAAEWLRASGSRDARLKELGDLVEVIWARGEMDGIDQAEIVTQAAGKRAARGSFDELLTMWVETGGNTAEPAQVAQASADGGNFRTGGDSRWYSG